MAADYYKLLGVDRKADATEIRKKYHKLARETHPDKTGSGRPEDADQFIKINKAAEVLLDDAKRKWYDMRVSVENNMNFYTESRNFSDDDGDDDDDEDDGDDDGDDNNKDNGGDDDHGAVPSVFETRNDANSDSPMDKSTRSSFNTLYEEIMMRRKSNSGWKSNSSQSSDISDSDVSGENDQSSCEMINSLGKSATVEDTKPESSDCPMAAQNNMINFSEQSTNAQSQSVVQQTRTLQNIWIINKLKKGWKFVRSRNHQSRSITNTISPYSVACRVYSYFEELDYI